MYILYHTRYHLRPFPLRIYVFVVCPDVFVRNRPTLRKGRRLPDGDTIFSPQGSSASTFADLLLITRSARYIILSLLYEACQRRQLGFGSIPPMKWGTQPNILRGCCEGLKTRYTGPRLQESSLVRTRKPQYQTISVCLNRIHLCTFGLSWCSVR